MKALVIDDYKYCELPAGVENIEAAIDFVNQNYHSFVKLKVWDEDKCVAPYFIEGLQKEEAVNISLVNSIEIKEIQILPEKEYVERLKECVQDKCMSCVHYINDGEGVESCRAKLSLDGECILYVRKEDC